MHTGGLLTKRVTAANQESGYIWRVSLRSQGLRNQRSHVTAVVTGRLLMWRLLSLDDYSCDGCCHWTITLARLSNANLGKPDTMRRTTWEIFFHFISIWPFRATATNGLYQAWRGELHGITKVCTDPSVRHYKGVHWSKGAILQECAQIQVCAPILLKSGYQYAVHWLRNLDQLNCWWLWSHWTSLIRYDTKSVLWSTTGAAILYTAWEAMR